MNGNHPAGNAVAIKQPYRNPGVLRGNDVDRSQYFKSPQGDI
jgi:hypothetical protein